MYQELGNYSGYKTKIQFTPYQFISYIVWRFFFRFIFRFTPDIKFVFNPLRIVILRILGAKIGKEVLIRPTVKIFFPWNLIIGDYSWIGEDVHLYNLGKICIGNNVCISQYVKMNTGSHDYLSKTFDLIVKPITLNDHVWVGANSFINLGTVIGAGTIIGVGSNVIDELPENAICVGNPCKKIKDRPLIEDM